MSKETIIIKYKELCKDLDKETEHDPWRDHSYLDLLRENTERNIDELLNGGETIAVDIDYDKKTVTVFWTPLQGEYHTLLGEEYLSTKEQQLYHLFTEAEDVARRSGIYDKYFMRLEE